jgi:GNAT superfamily N-acetyltransferase
MSVRSCASTGRMLGLGVVDEGRQVETGGGVVLWITRTAPGDHRELFDLFRAAVVAGEGYPQHPDRPLSFDDFEQYWLAPARDTLVARRVDDRALVGACTIKANGVGRAAHVANAGYVVAADQRGVGIGTALVEASFQVARELGFDAMQFNFVFASNPARRLYERLGFRQVGEVPDVIDGEAVCIYWREL